MKCKAVVFDLDGTLLNTLDDLADSLNRVLIRNAFPPHPTEAYRYFVGNGAPILVRRALPADKCDTETVDRCLRMFRVDYSHGWNVKTKPYDGILEMLEEMSAHGVVTAVLTNKPHDFAQLCVRSFFPSHRFAVVMGHGLGMPPKPDPAGALRIAESLSLQAGDFAYLGDSAVDMETANAARMYAVGATWGFRSREELLAGGAAVLIDEPGQLLSALQ